MGGSARFVGSNANYLGIASDVAALKFDNPDSSFSVWFRMRSRGTASHTDSNILTKFAAGTCFAVRYLSSLHKPAARIIQSSSGASHDAVSVHRVGADGIAAIGVAVSISPIYMRLFQDGLLHGVLTSAWNGTIFNTTQPWWVGRDGDGTANFTGDVCDIAIWNVALQPSEFKAMGEGCSPLRIGGAALKGYWPLDESSGNRRDIVAGNSFIQTGIVGAGEDIPFLARPKIFIPGEDLTQSFTGEAPANTVAPVASGTPEVGQTLSCTTGTWTGVPAPSFTYQWQYNDGVWNDIAGATNATWVVTVAGAVDVGDSIRCNVTGTNASGAATAASNTLGPVTDITFANHYMGAAVS